MYFIVKVLRVAINNRLPILGGVRAQFSLYIHDFKHHFVPVTIIIIFSFVTIRIYINWSLIRNVFNFSF